MTADPFAARAQVRRGPDGLEQRSISGTAIAAVAGSLGISLRSAEILALERGIVPERYQRNIGSIGVEGQRALLQARVAILGVGGIGGTALELCARLGFGRIVLFDGDRFGEGNLNRQIIATADTIGRMKADAAVDRAAQVNPSVEVAAYAEPATADNLPGAIRECAAVIDGLDSLAARLAAERACAAESIPFVHGAVAGFSGQVATIYPREPGISRIYGPVPDGTASAEATAGTPAVAPFMVASWQVLEATRIVLGRGAGLRRKLLLIDALELSVRTVDL